MRKCEALQESERERPCPRRILRFLEPCLLLLLHKRAAHGYELSEDVAFLGLDSQRALDSSLIYRTLRSLEAQGRVISNWDTESSAGPARRVYHLTESGDRYLANWMADLEETVQMLNSLLSMYNQHMAEDRNAAYQASGHSSQ
jgi:PadR family transcriptional regulator PadR